MAYSSKFTESVLNDTYKNGSISVKKPTTKAPTPTTKKKKEDERTWFDTGALSDGYQFGDFTKILLGTKQDITGDAYKGIYRMGEAVIDTGAYLLGGASKILGNDEFADKTKKFIARNLVDESGVVENTINNSVTGLANNLINKRYEAINPFNEKAFQSNINEDNSLLGDKTDSLVQSAVQLLGTAGLQMVGVPWWVTTGVTSFGGETEQAFNKKATYGEAGFSGLVSAGAEILTEKISGGISFGGKTLDSTLTKAISEGISNKTVRTLTKLGVDMTGEGAEEILSSVLSNMGKKLSYEDDKTWKEALASEEAIDEYIESFIGGAVLGGAGSSVNIISDNQKEKIKAETETRIKQLEQQGEKVSEEQKQKIAGEVVHEIVTENASNNEIAPVKETTQDIAPIREDTQERINQLEAIKQQVTTEQQYNNIQNEINQVKQAEQKDVKRTNFTYDTTNITDPNEKSVYESASRIVNDTKEDDLFSALNDDPLFIDDVQVDINPINENETGTLENYMKRSNEYDKEILSKTKPTKYSVSDNQGRTLTKEQQDFFKDSKVRDEEGNLLTMYHGTPYGGFNVFSDSHMGSMDGGGYFGDGFYFTNNRELAREYSDENFITDWDKTDVPGEYGNVEIKEVYLDIKNPYMVDGSKTEYKSGELEKLLGTDNSYQSTKKLKEMGYDGVIYDDGAGIQEITAFKSNQIKNVDNTNPTTNEDIRKSLSNQNEDIAPVGDYNVSGEDIKLQETIAPIKAKLEATTKELKSTIKDTNKELKALKKAVNDVKTNIGETIAPIQETKALTQEDLPAFEKQNDENFKNIDESSIPPEQEPTIYNEDTITMDQKAVKALNKNARTLLGLDNKLSKDLESVITEYSKGINDKETLYNTLEDKFGKQKIEEKLEDIYDIQKILRNKPLKVSPEIQADIKDYFYIKQKNFGKIRFSKTGSPVDVVYQELSDIMPAYFPNDIWNESDQFMKIVELANADKTTVEEFKLDEETIQLATDYIYDSVQEYKQGERLKASESNSNKSLEDMIPYEIPNASNTEVNTEVAPIEKPTLKEVVNESEDPFIKAVQNQIERKEKAKVNLQEDEYRANNVVTKKKQSLKESFIKTWDAFQSHMVNRNRQIDKLAKAKNNPEIKYKGDRVNNISGEVGGDIYTAQTDNYGNVIGKALDTPFEAVRKAGIENEFDNYLKHKSNIERHERGKGSKQISAKTSQDYVNAYESKFPEFKGLSQDVYTYNQNLLGNAVQNGLIDSNFKDMLTSMYGNYVPFFSGETSPSVNQSIDEIKSYRPIKRAKGGSGATLLGVEQAMIQQTYAYKNAIAKNDLYKEIGKSYKNKVELGADVRTSATDLQSTLYADENGKYLTYYDNGQQQTVEISDELYSELSRDLERKIKELEEKYSLITKPLQKLSQIRGQILTTYNPGFVLTNPFNDAPDALLNTKNIKGYFKKTISQSTISDSIKGKKISEYATEFKRLTGKDITSIKNADSLKGKVKSIYKDYKAGLMWNRFITTYGTNATSMEFGDNGIEVNKKNIAFLNGIEKANNYMEVMFRYPEFKATLEKGGSFTEALYNAREVTTNFGRGGTIAKAINRNGAVFFNTSIQGMDKFFRNFSGENGAKGFIGAVSKAITIGIIPAILNHLLFGSGDEEDEDYEALPDYRKDNYYLFKKDDGTFIRIPKGRMVSVLGSAARRTLELAQGDENAFEGFLKNADSQVGSTNPLKENILSPLIQAYGSENGEAWYGGDLVPTRLQNKPKGEQYDEGTDEFSKWLGEQLNISPYKLNYVIDQYSGGFGDLILPTITEEAKSDGTLLAPIKDKFTVNSTDDNKYVGELYDLGDELAIKSNGNEASETDKLRNKYINSIKSELGELYKEKREVQNSSLSKEKKYEKVKSIQAEINSLAKEGIDNYKYADSEENYAVIGGYDYYKNTKGEWYSVNEEESADLGLMGMTTHEKSMYFGAKNNIYKIKDNYGDLLDEASEDEKSSIYTEQKREIIDQVLNSNLNDEGQAYLYDKYYASTDKLNAILETQIPMETYLGLEYQNYTADKDRYGRTKSGSKKAKIMNYIENASLDYGQKLLLHKVYYPADDSYNYELVDYVFNNVEAYDQITNILETLGFKIRKDGVVEWD